MNIKKGSAVIIGGGISGLASAYYLLKSGWKVTLLDKGDLFDNCSIGNAGMIVPSHFIPLAAPGMISKGIKWMFNSRSPFYVKPSLDFSLISWIEIHESSHRSQCRTRGAAFAGLSFAK
jgi:D-amino-acid dehydrogenase